MLTVPSAALASLCSVQPFIGRASRNQAATVFTAAGEGSSSWPASLPAGLLSPGAPGGGGGPLHASPGPPPGGGPCRPPPGTPAATPGLYPATAAARAENMPINKIERVAKKGRGELEGVP